MWQERADYGHFFYRIPNGESAADAYDRVSGFNESLWRQFGDNDFASVCVLVTHGLMSRVFLMKWYHFTVEYFEDLRNVNHCEFLIMRKQEESGKYILENNLRTWSELRRERVLQGKEKQVAPSPIEKTKSFIPTRRWGGCPNGCNHQSHYVRRDDLESLRQTDEKAAAAASTVCKPHSQAHSQTPSVSSLARVGGILLVFVVVVDVNVVFRFGMSNSRVLLSFLDEIQVFGLLFFGIVVLAFTVEWRTLKLWFFRCSAAVKLAPFGVASRIVCETLQKSHERPYLFHGLEHHHGLGRLRHVHLHLRDLDQALLLYRLGSHHHVLLRCRHHHLCLYLYLGVP
ncbi:Broad-range acid phosphatase DET1 like protein [Verticillium longisporum]|nr:Broad-range acid phosphatase DET1 like protein [Verticillium longisporum]